MPSRPLTRATLDFDEENADESEEDEDHLRGDHFRYNFFRLLGIFCTFYTGNYSMSNH